MLYMIIGEDVADSLEKRKAARPAHLDRIQQLLNKGRLIIAGPNPAIDNDDPGDAGFTGSLIVAEFGSLEEARAWAQADPYIEAGVYAKITVKPYRQALP